MGSGYSTRGGRPAGRLAWPASAAGLLGNRFSGLGGLSVGPVLVGGRLEVRLAGQPGGLPADQQLEFLPARRLAS